MTEHIHKYMRVKLGNKGFKVYKCVGPDCPHWVRSELVIGLKTICWRCGNAVTMTQRMATLKKPHCINCTRKVAA